MGITITPVSPINLAANVARNVEIVFNITTDGGDTVDLTSVDVTIDDGIMGEIDAMTSGLFVNNWSGEIIDNTGSDDDYTFVFIKPIDSPIYPSGVKIDVSITALVD